MLMISMNSNSEEVVNTGREAKGEEKQKFKEMLNTREPTAEEMESLKRYTAATIKHFQDMGDQEFDLSEKSVKFMSEIIDEQRPHQGIGGDIPFFTAANDEQKPDLDNLRVKKSLVSNGLVTYFRLVT